MSALIVNFFGGPGVSKSTMAAHVFAELKWLGINCELTTEYAKRQVWEESFKALEDQRRVYGEQYHAVWAPSFHVDVIVTDSPLLLSIIYDKENDPEFKALVMKDFRKFNNFNILIERKKKYVKVGRIQDERQAIEKDNEIKKLLVDNNIEFNIIAGERESTELVVQKILECVNRKNKS